MQWKNVKLIFLREMRDQLRDRRTLFLIAVLPLLLYPLLGMSFLQMSQFLQSHPARVLVIGDEQLAEVDWLPPLIDGDHFDRSLFTHEADYKNIELVRIAEPAENAEEESTPRTLTPREGESREDYIARLLETGQVQVVVEFPPGFADGLEEARQAVLDRDTSEQTQLPNPELTFKSANDKSLAAQMRVDRVLHAWRGEIGQKNLTDSDVPVEATRPFQFKSHDTAAASQKQVAVLSKILPFVLIIWALTGAFYPAVDLCAGEKERGTLETLLTSPASRREIVWGKLLTVMLFSSATALLNMATLGLTGKFVTSQMAMNPAFASMSQLSLPPAASMIWLVLALIPISALFGALCLACAAFARSTKEGQYYLMPLMLVAMPFLLLPMSPGVELNLGNSLLPLTGLILLLKSCIEGQYLEALRFVIPVLGVTSICCLLAIRWAEEQFASESVLFRESERLDLGRWVKSLIRDRQATPTLAQAVLCTALILVVQFFVTVAYSAQSDGALTYRLLVNSTVVMQLVCILTPAAMMTLILTRNPAKTLLLNRWPKAVHLLAAALLACFVHPISIQLTQLISKVYPMSPDMQESMLGFQDLLFSGDYWWAPYLLIAVLPAICEEIAFRGFILSGLRRMGHKWWAIGISAVVFGLVHTFLQQKISAAAIGLIIGYLAVQTGSLLPCMLFHAMHNGLQIAAHQGSQYAAAHPDSALASLLGGSDPLLYRPLSVALCGVVVAAILMSLGRAKYRRSKEELLQQARERGATLMGA